MQYTHLKCTTRWLLAYSELCVHHHSQFFWGALPPNEMPYLLVLTPDPPLPVNAWQPLIYCLSLWIGLFCVFHIKGIVCDLSCLAYFIEHNAFKVNLL